MNTFTDSVTEAGIHWDEIWRQLDPTSEMGIQYKKELKPFLPGDEAQWDREMALMSRLVDSESITHCKRILSEIKNIVPILDLFHSGYTGTVAEWFMVKQFLFESHALLKLLEPEWIDAPAASGKLQFLLYKLNSGEQLQRTFTIDDLGDEVLRKLRGQKLTSESALRIKWSELEKKVKEELELEWKTEPFFVSVQDTETTAKLALHSSIREVTRTPFEIGYKLVPSEEIDDLARALEQLVDDIASREKQLLAHLQTEFLPNVTFLKELHHTIGEWDWRMTKVEWVKKVRAVRPCYLPGQVTITEARHPFIETIAREKKKTFTPVTMMLKPGVTTIVGPNMGGKSVALKTVAVSVMLFHYGLWIPAEAFSGYFFPSILLVKGDIEQPENGLSTFGAEISRIASVLKETKGLLLFDEIGRGTNPEEGSRLAAAIASYMQERAYFCLMVTHFASVLEVEGMTCYRAKGLTEEGMKLLHSDFAEALRTGIDYTIELVENNDIPQQALFIARALGLPEEIIEKAKREENDG